jgi:hypothetical protein
VSNFAGASGSSPYACGVQGAIHDSACSLNVTLWNDPVICRRVSWCSALGIAGFACAVRGAFPELCSCEMSFFYLQVGGRWDTERKRILSDADICWAIQSIRAAYAATPMSRDQPSFYVHNDGKSPDASPGHAKKSASASSPPARSSSSGASVRSRQRQSAMLRRDGNRCVFCGHDVLQHLQCAHIVDHKHCADSSLLDAACLFDTFDAINGLTLCIECHKAFDAGLICVDASTKLLILADRTHLAAKSELRGSWRELSGSPMRSCSSVFSAYWPTPELFAYQQARVAEKFARKSPKAVTQAASSAVQSSAVPRLSSAATGFARRSSPREAATAVTSSIARTVPLVTGHSYLLRASVASQPQKAVPLLLRSSLAHASQAGCSIGSAAIRVSRGGARSVSGQPVSPASSAAAGLSGPQALVAGKQVPRGAEPLRVGMGSCGGRKDFKSSRVASLSAPGHVEHEHLYATLVVESSAAVEQRGARTVSRVRRA